MINCSVGIFVYNEEKNIERLLESVGSQILNDKKIEEIIIVVSGSTDKTYELTKKYLKIDKRVKLIRQEKREGKASAVNLFIKNAKNDILVLLGGDLILGNNVISELISKFRDEEVGMVGAHPIPLNKIDQGISSFAGNLLWDLHHRVSIKNPKMGEVVAFKKVFKRIPIYSSVDEANIEPLIRGQGYKIVYAPRAKIYNKTPTTIMDFVAQRRRIYSGHLAVKREQGYAVSTMSLFLILKAVSSFLKDNPRPKFFLMALFTAGLEACGRFLGWWDYKIAKRKHTIWKVIETTKDLNM